MWRFISLGSNSTELWGCDGADLTLNWWISKELTALPLVLHSYVFLVLAGILMKLALVTVVLSIAAANRLLRFALTAEGAHAFSRQAVRRLDAGAAVAASHVGARVLESCRRRQTWKHGLVKCRGVLTQKSTPVQQLYLRSLCFFPPECIMPDRPPYSSGRGCTFVSPAQLFWVSRTTWHIWVRTHCHSCLLLQTTCVSFCGAAQIEFGPFNSQRSRLLCSSMLSSACLKSDPLNIYLSTNESEREEGGGKEAFSPRTLFPP